MTGRAVALGALDPREVDAVELRVEVDPTGAVTTAPTDGGTRTWPIPSPCAVSAA